MSSQLLIVFGKRTAEEVREVALARRQRRFDRVEAVYFREELAEEPDFLRWKSEFESVHYHVAVIDSQVRRAAVAFAQRQGLVACSVIAESASVATSAKIGEGCFVGPQAVVSSHAVLGRHAIVHLHASVGHDAVIGDHCAVLPGARVSGNVRLGEAVLVGSNSVVFQGVTVGDRTQIDALTYVRRDVGEGMLISSRLPKPVRRPDGG